MSDTELGKRDPTTQGTIIEETITTTTIHRTTNTTKKLKTSKEEYTVREADYDPLDNLIERDGEDSSDHTSINSDNFDEAGFLNFMKKNLERGDATGEFGFASQDEDEEDFKSEDDLEDGDEVEPQPVDDDGSDEDDDKYIDSDKGEEEENEFNDEEDYE